MWALDRLSAQSSPSGTPPLRRGPSPTPRSRPGLGALPSRPSFGPRSSSLSLSGNSSTASLPGSARVNGSALKHELYSTRPDDTDDPLAVLQEILGTSELHTGSTTAGPLIDKPEVLVEEVEFGGLSLTDFADEQERADSQTVRPVEEYNKEKDKFEDLHRSVLACDEVLKSVETYLTGFKSDLAAVSAEIETLQNRSAALNTKLENRKVVEKLLGPSVEEFSISPAVIRKIVEGPIDDDWVKALLLLEKRAKIITGKADDQDTKALADLKPLLKDLSDKAVERIRDHVVAQIKAIRSPSINAQLIQQQQLLRFKDLFAFMSRHQPKLAEEIVQAYINTMRWYYLSCFTRYHTAILSLKLHVIDKSEVLGSPDLPTASGPTPRPGAAKAAAAPHDAFTLGRRLDALKTSSTAALPSYVAEDDKSHHYLETPFRSFNLALIDNASFEYSFLTTFLSPTQSHHIISRTFSAIFEPTFALGQSLTKHIIDSTNDALGVLLGVRLNQQFAFELQRRKIPTVDAYVNGTNMLLWPKFQLVIDAHCESLRKTTAALPARPAAASTVLSSNSLATQSIAPHPLTQRFANFIAGILALSSEAGDDEPVGNSLNRLRTDFEAFLIKMSKTVSTEKRKQERFLENNYMLIGTILEGIDGRLAQVMRDFFKGLQQDL